MHKLWQYKLTLIITIIVLYGLLMPGDSIPSVSISIPHLDKFIHIGMFFAITGAFYLEYYLHHLKFPRYVSSILSLTLFGALTEVMQGTLTTTRSFDIFDLLADCVGILLAVFCWHIIQHRFPSILTFIKKFGIK